jgi:hypothetical protein
LTDGYSEDEVVNTELEGEDQIQEVLVIIPITTTAKTTISSFILGTPHSSRKY